MVTDKRRHELLHQHFYLHREKVLETYRGVSPDAAERLARQRMRRAVGAVCHNLPEGGRVLDLGSGCGIAASTLAELGFEVTAVELIPEILEEAKRRTSAAVNWVNQPFDLKVGEIGSFDAVLSLGFLEYQERAGKELVRMRRMLKPGGLLVLSVPNTLSPRFHYGLTRALFRLGKEPEEIPVRHSFTPERLQRCLGMAGFILLDYEWLPPGEGSEPLDKERERDFLVHRMKLRTAEEMLTLSRTYTDADVTP